MMSQGSGYNYLRWLHYVAGTCGPSCPYCPSFSPDEPYTTLSCEHVLRYLRDEFTNHLASSVAPYVTNHDNFDESQSTIARPADATSTLSIGVDHDDRTSVADTRLAYAYSTPPGSFHGCQNINEVYQLMGSHYQLVQNTYMYVLRAYGLQYPG